MTTNLIRIETFLGEYIYFFFVFFVAERRSESSGEFLTSFTDRRARKIYISSIFLVALYDVREGTLDETVIKKLDDRWADRAFRDWVVSRMNLSRSIGAKRCIVDHYPPRNHRSRG